MRNFIIFKEIHVDEINGLEAVLEMRKSYNREDKKKLLYEAVKNFFIHFIFHIHGYIP